MRRDKAMFWVVVLYVLASTLLGAFDWHYKATTHVLTHYFEDPAARQTDVPEAARKFSWLAAEIESNEVRAEVARYVAGSTSVLLTTTLIAFIVVTVRQRRLTERLDRIEATGHAAA